MYSMQATRIKYFIKHHNFIDFSLLRGTTFAPITKMGIKRKPGRFNGQYWLYKAYPSYASSKPQQSLPRPPAWKTSVLIIIAAPCDYDEDFSSGHYLSALPYLYISQRCAWCLIEPLLFEK
jgi:hypothetical protein